MREILPFVDVLIGNEEDAEDVLGIRAGDSRVDAGRLDVQGDSDVASKTAEQFPNVRKIAITLRESISADDNNWAAMPRVLDLGRLQSFIARGRVGARWGVGKRAGREVGTRWWGERGRLLSVA